MISVLNIISLDNVDYFDECSSDKKFPVKLNLHIKLHNILKNDFFRGIIFWQRLCEDYGKANNGNCWKSEKYDQFILDLRKKTMKYCFSQVNPLKMNRMYVVNKYLQ